MDNAAEFLSRAFNDYCIAQGIEVQHIVPSVHTKCFGRISDKENQAHCLTITTRL
jgi:hypothetical protein